MLKGRQRRMIVVRAPDSRLFEEAIFILRDDILQGKAEDNEDVLRQARKVAEAYTRAKSGTRRLGLSAPIAAFFGAAATGLAWLATRLLGVLV